MLGPVGRQLRTSSQQADVLKSELEAYRRILTPIVFKICDTFLRFEGLDNNFEICWNEITLQDGIEVSKTRLYNAQAEKIEMETKNININGDEQN